MKITSNDIGSSSSAQQTLDSKVIELLNKLAARPLLLDKLSLSKDLGTQLLLNTPQGKLRLQMPMHTAQQLQASISSLGNNVPSVQLTLNDKNQLVLKVNSPVPLTNASSRSDNLQLGAQPSQVVFAQAKLIGTQLLKLEAPILLAQANNTRPAESSPSIQPNHKDPSLINPTKQQMVNQRFLSGGNLKGIHTLASQHHTPSHQGKLSLVSLSQSDVTSPTSIRVSPGVVNTSGADTSQIIKNFLRQSFPNKAGISNNIQTMRKQVVALRQIISDSLVTVATSRSKTEIQAANQIINQSNTISKLMNQLFKNISEPMPVNASSLKERITNSGNLLESKLAAPLVITEQKGTSRDSFTKLRPNNPQSPLLAVSRENIAQNQPIQTSLTNLKSNLTSNNANHINMNSSDIKLLLVQIKAQVEKLLGQLNTLAPRTTSEVSSQTVPHLASSPTAAITEQIRRELDTTNHSLLRNESSIRTDAANHGKRNATNLPNMLLSIGHSNQATKLLNDIVVEVRSALNQIETNQLLSLRAEQPNIHQFLVDLPFTHNKQIDSFELLFEHNTDQTGKTNKHWKVVVRFDLDPLGPMFAQVELKDNRISTDIFAESQPTAKLINEHLHVLQKSLSDAGLDIDKIASSQGRIPESLVKNTEHSVDIRV